MGKLFSWNIHKVTTLGRDSSRGYDRGPKDEDGIATKGVKLSPSGYFHA